MKEHNWVLETPNEVWGCEYRACARCGVRQYPNFDRRFEERAWVFRLSYKNASNDCDVETVRRVLEE